MGGARLLLAVEEHGAGRQFLRFRIRPICTRYGVTVFVIWAMLALGAVIDQAWIPAAAFRLAAFLLVLSQLRESAAASLAVLTGIRHIAAEVESSPSSTVVVDLGPLARVPVDRHQGNGSVAVLEETHSERLAEVQTRTTIRSPG